MNNFPFARRTNWRQESNALNKALEDLKVRHIPVMDLTVSNPTECGFTYPEGILSALSCPENLHYQPEAAGMETARRAVAEHYSSRGLALSSHDIILTASTSEAYTFLMRLLVNPGEKVLIPRPSYPLFQFLFDIHDIPYDYYPLVFEGQWRLDCRALERLADDSTRAIVLVNPNNPTGSYITAAELDFLSGLCARRRMALISDEVFSDYALEPGHYSSLMGHQGALTFVLGGLSKMLGLPQMKCAWMAVSGPGVLAQEAITCLDIIADTYLSVNTPVQNALKAWLALAPRMQEQIISRLKENLHWLSANIGPHAELLPLQGGWYATLRIPAVKSEEEWVLQFLREDQVLVYPGYFFDFEREAYIVLSLLAPPAVFQEASGRIRRRLDSL